MMASWVVRGAGVKERADMRTLMARLRRDDEGQDLVEYVLLVSLIALLRCDGVPCVDDRHHRRSSTRRSTTLGGEPRWWRFVAVVSVPAFLCSLGCGGSADDSGQDVVEYALLTAFFGLAAPRGVDQHSRRARP